MKMMLDLVVVLLQDVFEHNLFMFYSTNSVCKVSCFLRCRPFSTLNHDPRALSVLSKSLGSVRIATDSIGCHFLS